jgi:hypothetical protein
MCGLDLNKRMEIYLDVLKEGTGALERHYKEYINQDSKKEQCELDVFIKAVMSC